MTFYPLTNQHFSLFSEWKKVKKSQLEEVDKSDMKNPHQNKLKWFTYTDNTGFSRSYYSDHPSFYLDISTGEIYNGDRLWLIRKKCIILLLLSPISQFFAILYQMIFLLWQLISLEVFFDDAHAKLTYLQKINAY